MLIVLEPVCRGAEHAPFNAGLLRTACLALPDADVLFVAERSHVDAVRAQLGPKLPANLATDTLEVAPRHVSKLRRFISEMAIMPKVIRRFGSRKQQLLITSATNATTLFAVLATRLIRLASSVRYIAVFHTQLNRIKWRSRNPLARLVDLGTAMTLGHRLGVRFWVLEHSIASAVVRLFPRFQASIDVLPHPVDRREAEARRTQSLSYPIRIGFLGFAKGRRGFDVFLDVARRIKARHGDDVEFHVIGRLSTQDDGTRLSFLESNPSRERLTRSDFIEAIQRLHFACLPLDVERYTFSASGTLLDAIALAKPIIALSVPLVEDLFKRYGDIGYLCRDPNDMHHALSALLASLDEERYRSQVATLSAISRLRTPEELAVVFRNNVDAGFPGLFKEPESVSR